MGLQESFDVLTRVVEQFESRGRSVRNVEVTTDTEHAGALAVELTVPVSLCAASSGTLDTSLTPEQASLTGNGGLSITFSVSDFLPEPTDPDTVVATDERAVHVDDGELIMTVGFRIESVDGSGSDGPTDETATRSADGDVTAEEAQTETTATTENADGDDPLGARLAAARSADVPAYDDTDYLRVLYESCETFTEMSDRIEMDVAAETVRRYMIEADIHDPTTYDTTEHASDDEETESPAVEDADTATSAVAVEPVPDEQFVTDGIGLPEGVTVEDIVDAVVNSTAVYEVQRTLDVDHDRTRDLLRQLNVLDLVVHRIDGPERPASKNEVVKRIRQCAVSKPASPGT